MIVNGKKIAYKIELDIIQRIKVLGRKPKLAVVNVDGNPVSVSFINMKKKFADRVGVDFSVLNFDSSIGSNELIAEIKKAAALCDGLVVQLPLPKHLDTDFVLESIPPEKDVDALGPNPIILSPVVEAIKKILSISQLSLKSKRVLVIGRGRLVGLPIAKWLGGNGTTVDIIGDEVENMETYTKKADIIISGAGSPHLIKPQMIKEGAALIDCGASEAGGKLLGDAHSGCAVKCSLFTPVPGGVGPITVAMLFSNLLNLAER